MNDLIVLFIVIFFFAVGFHVGGYAAMRSVRIGAKWRLGFEEQQELDRLIEKALTKERA